METTVNERIMMLKKHFNLTTDEFASKSNLSRTTIWTIQNGSDMKPKTINTICDSLNVNKEWLLHGKGKMFAEAPKEVAPSNNNPWKDALVSQVKEENNRLVEQLKFYQNMVSQLMQGVKPNFLKVSDYAYSFVLPNRKTLKTVSDTKVC